jgi:hypothetical protein
MKKARCGGRKKKVHQNMPCSKHLKQHQLRRRSYLFFSSLFRVCLSRARYPSFLFSLVIATWRAAKRRFKQHSSTHSPVIIKPKKGDYLAEKTKREKITHQTEPLIFFFFLSVVRIPRCSVQTRQPTLLCSFLKANCFVSEDTGKNECVSGDQVETGMRKQSYPHTHTQHIQYGVE